MEKKIIETIRREYERGYYRDNTNDLPWELHYRLSCKWEKAQDIADDIRANYRIMNKECQCKQCTGMDEY